MLCYYDNTSFLPIGMSHSKTITDLFEFDYENDKNFNFSCKFLLNVPIVMDGDVLHIRNEMFPV